MLQKPEAIKSSSDFEKQIFGILLIGAFHLGGKIL